MSVCSNFIADTWRPKKCRSCFHMRDEHVTAAPPLPPESVPPPTFVQINSDQTTSVKQSNGPSSAYEDKTTTGVLQNPSLNSDPDDNISRISTDAPSVSQSANENDHTSSSTKDVQEDPFATDVNIYCQEGKLPYSMDLVHLDQNVSNLPLTDENVMDKQQKEHSSFASTDVNPSTPSTIQKPSSSKQPCSYGDKCYRKNAEHLARYSHPSEIANTNASATRMQKAVSSSKIPCKYAEKCYRNNPEHLLEYWHPPKTDNDRAVLQQKVQEDFERQKAQIETERQKLEQELQFKQMEMEKARMKMQQELEQQRAEMELQRQKAEEDLRRQKEMIDVEHQKLEKNWKKTQEDLQQSKKTDDTLQEHVVQMEEERKKAQLHLELVEKRFRESMVNADMEKRELEELVKKLRKETVQIAKSHQQLENALGQELDNRERREIEKQRILEIRRDVPNYWGIKTFDEPYREIEIPSSSPEFLMTRDFLNQTIEPHGNEYGTIDGKDPTEFVVTKITRIHNKNLWHQYCFKKESIIAKHNNQLIQCESSKYLMDHPSIAPLLDSSANEYWLFHGCEASIAQILIHEGYDPRVSSLDGMFGGGFYLAENSSKSNQYIPCPGCGRNSIFQKGSCKCKSQQNLEFYIILYRAVLGDVHVATKYDEKKYRCGQQGRRVRRPPCKENSGDLYDSVMGESKTHGGDGLKYREFILYETNQAYPEYLIRFRRSAANVRTPSDIQRMKNKCYFFLKNTFNMKGK